MASAPAAYPTFGPRPLPTNQPYGTYPGSTIIPYQTSSDPSVLAANERARSTNQGDQWSNEFGPQSSYYGQGETDYSNLVSGQYGPIWSGGGGYTPEMQGNILQQPGMDQIQSQLPGNFLNADEQTGIGGSPYAAFDLSKGYQQGLSTAATDANSLESAVSPRTASQFGSTNQQYQTQLGGAIDPSRLRTSPGLQSGLNSYLAGGSTAAHDPGLNVTDDYLSQSRVSDKEVSDMQASAGRDATAPYQSAISKLYSDAAAAGTTNPLAVAAKRQELLRGSGSAMADAELKARIAGRAQQESQAQNIQNTELGAAGSRAGYGLQFTGQGLGTTTTAEGMRVGAEQELSDRQIQAAQGVANLNTDSTKYMSGLDVQTAQDIGNRNIGVGQYNANLGTGLVQTAEQAAAQRAAMLGTNRQGVATGNQAMQYNLNNAASNRYTQAYQPWVQAQQEGRQAAIQQQGYMGGRTQDTNQLRLNGWQVGQGGSQNALQLKNQIDQTSKSPSQAMQWVNTAANLISGAKPKG